ATVVRGSPDRDTWFGAMRTDAALTAAPPPRRTEQRGRPRQKGDLRPSPAAHAKDPRVPWRTCTYTNHDQTYTARYKVLDAQWYPHKDQVSFPDILRAARRTLEPRRIFEELRRSGNLPQFTPPAGSPVLEPLREAS